MRPFSTAQLLTLAEAYCAGTGETLHALSAKVSDNANHKLFGRLKNKKGCSAEYLERASAWFAENWPDSVPWPARVPTADGDATARSTSFASSSPIQAAE